MAQGIEYHGRLTRSDGRPANPGLYSLLFSLHPDQKTRRSCWEEQQDGVTVRPGGYFRVVLGDSKPLRASFFRSGPRWLAVRVVRRGRVEPERDPRTRLTGGAVLLDQRITDMESAIEEQVEAVEELRRGPTADQFRAAFDHLARELHELRATALPALGDRLAACEERLAELLDDEGRLDRLEERLDELDGADGDVLYLIERMDALEAMAPDLFERIRSQPSVLAAMASRLDLLERQNREMRRLLDELEVPAPAAAPAAPRPEDIGAVRRSGDVMTGGLTINRGGIKILSGGVESRSARVTTLEASRLVRAPKVLAEAIELQGDLTVDNLHRAVQVRHIEGRISSGRQDGMLALNSRGGGRVEVGNPERARGMHVFGPLSSAGLLSDAAGLAERFPAEGRPSPGEVVCLVGPGRQVARCRQDEDPRAIGVVCESPGLLLGQEGVAVVLRGTADCMVEAEAAPIEPGDWLVASGVPGHARAHHGVSSRPAAAIGRALASLHEGRGTIPVLVG